MKLRFSKMHGLGNDFVVFDAIRQQVRLTPAQYRFIADRRFGIGCDQILLVERARLPNTDFHYRIFNADGTEVEACGNGARCFASFVHEQGLSEQSEIRVGTAAGAIVLKHLGDGQVEVEMGTPVLEPERIPFDAPSRAASYLLDVQGIAYEISAVSMGNPHAVLLVPSADDAPVARLGPLIEHHPRFPKRVNVGFLQIENREEVSLRVYERGTGETLACGSGACAAVVAGRLLDRLDSRVKVHLRGGDLVIEWPGKEQPVRMRGSATFVFDGSIDL